jgi:hypothetical protein
MSPYGTEVMRGIRWNGHVARLKYMRNAYKIFVGKPEWKRTLRNLRFTWKDNIVTLPGNGSINTPLYAHATIGRMFIARC